MKRRQAISAYFVLLFLFLGTLFLPAFSNPPYVDHWEAFFTFHQVRADPDLSVWPYVVNHDPWRHGTFRPLSYTLLYLQHLLFSGAFVWNHVLNFAVYCLHLVLLFLLGRKLGGRDLELAGFLAVYSVAYSHSDILLLNFHIFVLAGFSACLGGFLLFHRFRENGRTWLLVPAGILLLLGMFCYEPFVLWPLAVFFLCLGTGVTRRRWGGFWPAVFLAGSVYLAYGLVFLLTRLTSQTSGDLPGLEFQSLLTGFFLSLFNFVYTGIGVSVWPALGAPPIYKGYSEMGGVIPEGNPPWLMPAALISGAAVIILLGGGIYALTRRKKFRVLVAALFLILLNLSFIAFLAAARSQTNNLSHILRQFRYQLVPTALVFLLAAVIVSALIPPRRRPRVILFFFLLAVFIPNCRLTRAHVRGTTENLRPLGELLASLREGMARGEITPDRQVFIPDEITVGFPHLCWNRMMGYKMRGSYQWIYSPAELFCFTPDREEAEWIVGGDPPGYRRNQAFRLWTGGRGGSEE